MSFLICDTESTLEEAEKEMKKVSGEVAAPSVKGQCSLLQVIALYVPSTGSMSKKQQMHFSFRAVVTSVGTGKEVGRAHDVMIDFIISADDAVM